MSRVSTKARRAARRRHRNEKGYKLNASGLGDHYDQQGRKIGLGTWAVMFEDLAQRIVRESFLPNGYHVSTIWLGLDHGFGPGPPVIFESMVFRPKSGEKSLGTSMDMERYCTRAEAIAGHQALVEEWSKRPRLDVVQEGADEP